MKMHILALWSRKRREMDVDKSGNKPCQQLSHCDRRGLSQLSIRKKQRQENEKMGSLGISAIPGPLDEVAGRVSPSGELSSGLLVLS